MVDFSSANVDWSNAAVRFDGSVAITGPVPPLCGNSNAPLQMDIRLAAGLGICFWAAITSPTAGPGLEFQHGTHAKAIYESQFKGVIFPSVAVTGQGPTVPPQIFAPPQYPEPRTSYVSLNSLTNSQAWQPLPLLRAEPQLYDFTQQAWLNEPVPNQAAGRFGSEYQFGTHAKALYDSQAGGRIWPAVRKPPLAIPIGGPISFVVPPQKFDPTLKASLMISPVQTGWISSFVSAGPDEIDLTLPAVVQRAQSHPLILGPTVYPAIVAAPQADPKQIAASVFTPSPQMVPGLQQPFVAAQPPDPAQRPGLVFHSVIAGGSRFVQPAFVKSFSQTYTDTKQPQGLVFLASPVPIMPTMQYSPAFFATFEQAYVNVPFAPASAPIVFGAAPVAPLPTNRTNGDRVTLPTKKLGETLVQSVDFISKLSPNETILTAVCSMTVYTGSDPSPQSMISGSAGISGTIVSQLVTGGVLGTIYELLAKVSTSAGQTLELSGYLAVVPDL